MTSALVDGPPDEAVADSPAGPHARRARRIGGSVAGVALIALAYGVSKNYEVVAEGSDLLPYPAQVAKIRFFDAFTLYVAQERTRPLDVIDAVLLSMIAGTAFFARALLRQARADSSRGGAFLLVAGLGALYLAADESLALHETIGDNLLFLSSLPGVERPDDLIFAGYILPAIVIVILFRDVIRASPAAIPLFGAAIALYFAAGAMDVAGIGVDELLEPLSSGCLLAGFTVLALDLLRAAGVLTGRPAPS
jgi:hypothetical protein